MQEDDPGNKNNFTAIWVFSPKDMTFKVFKQFDIVEADPNNANSLPELAAGASSQDYHQVVWSTKLVPNEDKDD